jgi:hypothetical protein
MDVFRLFAIHQACALTGFSKYMLDYLEREQIYVSSGNQKKGRGVRREYTYTDIVLLKALKSICDDAGKIRHLGKALAIFKKRYGSMTPGILPSEYLIARRGKIYVKSGESVIEEAITGQQAFSFVVDMSLVTKSVNAKIVIVDSDRFALRPSAKAEAEEIRRSHWESIKERRDQLQISAK